MKPSTFSVLGLSLGLVLSSALLCLAEKPEAKPNGKPEARSDKDELKATTNDDSDSSHDEETSATEAATSTSSQEWQLAQLHREQIAMQLSLDEHQLQVRNLSAELAAVRSQSEGDLVELRQILGEHEATIASLEREKSSLLERLRENDRRRPGP